MRLPQLVHLSAYDVERRLGMERNTLVNFARRGELMDPDVSIGSVLTQGRTFKGYHPDRAVAWGIYTGFLTQAGEVRERRVSRRSGMENMDNRPGWWNADTKRFLGATDLSVLWGVKYQTVKQRRPPDRAGHGEVTRGAGLPDVDCVVGSVYKKTILGWRLNTAVVYGRREGFNIDRALVNKAARNIDR